MLNLIRDNVQSFGIKFIVGIVVLVMAFFGISTYRSQSSNTIVTVDGYEVKVDRFHRAYENRREEIRSTYGANASEYLKMINLEKQILEQLTNSALLLKSANESGLAVTDLELAQEIYHTQAFMTDKRFDPGKYEQGLKNMRTDKLSYEKDLKESLLTRKLIQFIGAGVLFSRTSLETEYRRFESELSVKAIPFEPSLFADQVEISDEELKEYYELNKSNFQQKGQLALTYFILGVDDVKDKVTVRDKEISRYYETNKEVEFTSKESFLSRHILVSSSGAAGKEDAEAKQKADEIYRQVVSRPEQFATLAEKHSGDRASAAKGGDLGWAEKGSYVAEFEAAIDRLKKNEIAKPIKTNFGYHIIQLLDRKEAVRQPFEQVKEGIKQTITINKAKRRLKNKVEKLLKESEGPGIETMAQATGKTTEKTELFDDTKNLKNLGLSRQLYQELKNATLYEKGQYPLSGNQQYVVYEVSEVKKPFVKPLDKVKGTVRFYALQEKKKRVANEKLDQLAAETKSAKAFDKVALTLNTKAIEAKFKFSDRQIKDLKVSQQFKADVFKMEKGQIQAVKDGDRGYLVFLVDKKKGELNEESKQALTMLGNLMRQQKAQVVLSSFINRMRTNVEITYNMNLLQAMNVRLDS